MPQHDDALASVYGLVRMYQRIIVGTDGSNRASMAVEHAAVLAEAFGAELHLVQGCGNPVAIAPIMGVVEPLEPAALVDSCRRELDPVADGLRARGLDVTVHVTPVDGVTALCAAASQLPADLIVVGNRGMTGARRLLGSVPNSVAHQAPCPVLVVPTS